MEPTFKYKEVFPVVARLIVEAQPHHSSFIGHDTIVSLMLTDDEGLQIISRASPGSALADDRLVASNMVAWFSQQITVGRSRWAEFFDRERRDGAWAYRPRTAIVPPIAADLELSAIEGDPRMFFHLRRERDAALAQAKRNAVRAEAGVLFCETCGFATRSVFPDLCGEVCEIHHCRPLAEAPEATETLLSDLSVLCANCHRAIYRTKPMMSVEEFRARFFPPTKLGCPWGCPWGRPLKGVSSMKTLLH